MAISFVFAAQITAGRLIGSVGTSGPLDPSTKKARRGGRAFKKTWEKAALKCMEEIEQNNHWDWDTDQPE
ncbi:hypothetical protein ACXHXM_10255|jgi:hypothetical protein